MQVGKAELGALTSGGVSFAFKEDLPFDFAGCLPFAIGVDSEIHKQILE